MDPLLLRFDPAAEFWTDERCHILELSNGVHDEAASIARARVEPGVVTRWHRLEGVVERYVILEGTGQVEVGDLPPQPVMPGDVVLIPAGCRQRIANAGRVDLVFLAVCTPRFEPAFYQDAETG